MWSAQAEQLAESRGTRLIFARQGKPATCAQVIDAWRSDVEFRELFSRTLAEVSYTAFRWESLAMTSDTLERVYECVLLNSPGLARIVDITAFAEHYCKAVDDVCVFPNLGADTLSRRSGLWSSGRFRSPGSRTSAARVMESGCRGDDAACQC